MTIKLHSERGKGSHKETVASGGSSEIIKTNGVATVSVTPSSSAVIKYIVSPGGTEQIWSEGTVTAATTMVSSGPFDQIWCEATGGTALFEVKV